MTKRDASRMESADEYPCIQLTPKWRIIECRDGEQWILQRRSNKWEGRTYCRTSAVLRRVVKEHVGAVELPDWLKQPVLGAAEQIEDVYYRDLHQNEKTKGGFWYLAGRIFEACKLTRASRST